VYYELANLTEQVFQDLCDRICKIILGLGVEQFSKGPDGGIDGRFCGCANSYPSEKSPWDGTVIIQAKHTDNPIASFSDSRFFGNKESTIKEETGKLKKLVDSNQASHYLLFSNRSLSAGMNDTILGYISKESGLPKESVSLFGKERLEDFIASHEILADYVSGFMPHELFLDPSEFEEIISVIGEDFTKSLQNESVPVSRTKFDKKNLKNGLSKEFAEYIIRTALPYQTKLMRYLQNPNYEETACFYYQAVEELNAKIVTFRKFHDSFDSLLNSISDSLFAKSSILKRKKAETRTILYLMYWNCDIG